MCTLAKDTGRAGKRLADWCGEEARIPTSPGFATHLQAGLTHGILIGVDIRTFPAVSPTTTTTTRS